MTDDSADLAQDGGSAAYKLAQEIRRLRIDADLSQARLAALIGYSPQYVSLAERPSNGLPSAAVIETIDKALAAGGLLIALGNQARAELHARRNTSSTAQADTDSQPNGFELIELTRRAGQSTIGLETLEELKVTTDELCRAYSTQDPAVLRGRTTTHLRYVLRLLDGRTTLDQHRELLVRAGWDALLLGCVAFDDGDRLTARQAQRLAYHLGEEAGHGQIVAWSYELGAWYALVEGRYAETVELSERGLRHAGESSAAVQLSVQASHGYARMGDIQARPTLEAGRKIRERLPQPERPEHHFVFDPDKHTFYVAKILAALGKDDAAAEEHAREVIDHCERAGRWPMRLAESQINLGLVAGRRGDLDEAAALGSSALAVERRSGGLLPHAEELLRALDERYPHEPLIEEYRERLIAAQRDALRLRP